LVGVRSIIAVSPCSSVDFDRLHRVHRSQSQLYEIDVRLQRIDELSTVVVASSSQHLSTALVQQIVEPIERQIFITTMVTRQSAFIEFICSDTCKRWLLESHSLERKFNVTIRPWIEHIDDVRSTPTEPGPRTENKTNPASFTEIKLKRSWAMVANHQNFSIEYKNFIRKWNLHVFITRPQRFIFLVKGSQLAGQINIDGDRVRVYDDPGGGASSDVPISSTALNDRTRQFMGRFEFRSVSLNQPTKQLSFLQDCAAIVAFQHTNLQNYMLAARSANINDLMQKLLAKKPVNTNSQVTNIRVAAESATKPKLILIPPPLANCTSSTNGR
jgi:hypothetical protein